MHFKIDLCLIKFGLKQICCGLPPSVVYIRYFALFKHTLLVPTLMFCPDQSNSLKYHNCCFHFENCSQIVSCKAHLKLFKWTHASRNCNLTISLMCLLLHRCHSRCRRRGYFNQCDQIGRFIGLWATF